ncbi:hypothetical protein IVB12_16070 [Bradyrhizobium sp. 179]|uniref:hypothetical protein n=1 Tax=Bradyrhizobium sp. 179 TaxID=2782648 RepID=UPI001FFBB5D2|nr:hypothetical protein [Bradyrhizobium sp. 179]MCK1543434.1 hypothetical protein [Bradyrhizobium sp. 179]
MTQRFLAGYHAGFNAMGVWLSQPGVDVTQAGPAANFLLRSDLKYEQIVLSGSLVVGSGQTVAVALPADLIKQPYLMLTANTRSDLEYPSDLGATAPGGANGNEVLLQPLIFRDQIQFYNGSQSTIVGFYIVFNRSVGT